MPATAATAANSLFARFYAIRIPRAGEAKRPRARGFRFAPGTETKGKGKRESVPFLPGLFGTAGSASVQAALPDLWLLYVLFGLLLKLSPGRWRCDSASAIFGRLER